MTDFRSTRQPPNVKNLLFQNDNLAVIRSTTGFQKLSFRSSPPIGNPKYTKGIMPVLQFKMKEY